MEGRASRPSSLGGDARLSTSKVWIGGSKRRIKE